MFYLEDYVPQCPSNTFSTLQQDQSGRMGSTISSNAILPKSQQVKKTLIK